MYPILYIFSQGVYQYGGGFILVLKQGVNYSYKSEQNKRVLFTCGGSGHLGFLYSKCRSRNGRIF
jgi:hypothetical protein